MVTKIGSASIMGYVIVPLVCQSWNIKLLIHLKVQMIKSLIFMGLEVFHNCMFVYECFIAF